MDFKYLPILNSYSKELKLVCNCYINREEKTENCIAVKLLIKGSWSKSEKCL
jgi:hypothetical protein